MNPLPVFWFLILALVATTLIVLVWPLVRTRPRDPAPDEGEATTAVLRDQRRQLDADHQAGLLSDEERARAHEELVARLGTELKDAPPRAVEAPSRLPWLAALMLVALLPAVAIVTYFLLGTPDAVRSASQDRPHAVSQEQMAAMVETLAARMRANPDDPNGWLLLARSYTALGRFREAAQAYAEAAQRVPEDAQLYADWADALAMAQGRTLAGEPTQLIERALKVDPRNRKALALDGTVKLERGDLAGALAQWRTLRTLVPEGTEEAQRVDAVIAEIEERQAQAGGAPASGRAASTKSNPSVGASPGTDTKPSVGPATSPGPKPSVATTRTDTRPSVGASTGGAVSGRVELAPALKGKLAAGDTLFVFARAAQGPRMPLAVLRVPAAELPRAFTLDDTMAMSPAMKLSTAGDVVIEARVSKSGNAAAQPGDLRGTSGVVQPGTANIRIVIGDVVP